MPVLYVWFCRELNAESSEKNFSSKLYKLTEILRKYWDRHLFWLTRYIILSSYICNYIRFFHLSCSINHLEVYVHNRLFVLIQRHICVYILVGAEHLLYIQWKSIKSIVQYLSFCNYMCSVLTKREGSFFFSLIIIHQRRTMEQINICMRLIVSVTLILDMHQSQFGTGH